MCKESGEKIRLQGGDFGYVWREWTANKVDAGVYKVEIWVCEKRVERK